MYTGLPWCVQPVKKKAFKKDMILTNISDFYLYSVTEYSSKATEILFLLSSKSVLTSFCVILCEILICIHVSNPARHFRGKF